MNTIDYSTVIFDLDGTLIDSLNELGIACNTILEQQGYPSHPLSSYKGFVGEGAEILMRKALGEASSDETILQACLKDFLSLYEEICGRHASLYPGIVELLNELRKRGMNLTVLSNKPHDLTLKNMDIFLSDIPFSIILGQRRGIPKKPDPHGVKEILNYLNVPAETCLYLGDTSIDMKTASAAGVYPVGVLWGFRSREELLESGARSIIEHPLDLVDLL